MGGVARSRCRAATCIARTNCLQELCDRGWHHTYYKLSCSRLHTATSPSASPYNLLHVGGVARSRCRAATCIARTKYSWVPWPAVVPDSSYRVCRGILDIPSKPRFWHGKPPFPAEVDRNLKRMVDRHMLDTRCLVLQWRVTVEHTLRTSWAHAGS